MANTSEFKPAKKKVQMFDVVNYIVFILLALIILLPLWKVLVDSFNAVGIYQFKFWPTQPTFDGYKTIFTTQKLYRPFVNSVVTTLIGTLLGLVMSTLGGYVLNQNDMPGKNGIAYFLLFTMIFSGGMIPE
ncbi:MAG: carbohydrate ABC transporter permease, partial [Pseudobutyrivibrio sp.]|nr:carbohydrate ABC transporter permease [Pseudobutyrivibrio sp.]